MFLHYGEKHGKYNEENWNRAKEWVREINWKISIAAKANREGKDPKKAISDALPPVGPEKETEH
jgi:hypothetical protein